MAEEKRVSAAPPAKPMVTITVRRHKGKLLDVPKKKNIRAPRLRKSLVPGTVVILLNGPHKGARVVMMKSLVSGLLLINGPFELNHIPLRRCSQHCVIATSTRVDVSGVDLSKFDDQYFMRSKAEKVAERKDRKARAKIGGGENGESIFMAEEQHKTGKARMPASKLQDQTKVDTALMAAIKKHKEPLLTAYLKKRFWLSIGAYPHQMVF
eukprot:GHVS01070912.1.p1 GENE.GHVS01070912.1~~GHVS01070912.1.p1  ORF type:complete len:210 (+),score=22.54 GHVS01070912.1:91-720(+)